MIYKNDKDSTVIKAFNVSEFSFLTGAMKNKGITFDSKLDYPEEQDNWLEVIGNLTGKSFVIESLPVGSKKECGKTDFDDLSHLKCKGKIRMRPI